MGGPGDHPGMARNAAAGPMDAGSDAVATTRTTIFSDARLRFSTPQAVVAQRLPTGLPPGVVYLGDFAPQPAGSGFQGAPTAQYGRLIDLMDTTRLGISSISNEIHESILYEQKINEGKKILCFYLFCETGFQR
jgi:hypothetical protein